MRALVVVAVLACLSSAFAAEIPPIRNVTPPGMTPGPAADGPLIREPAPPRPPDPPRWRRFFLPVTSDAATFVISDLTIHIAGVAPPSVDATCRLADGSEWPCGRTALYAFRMFLHGRAVECFFAPPAAAEVTAPCRVGQTDLARWLLTAGWANPAGFPSDDDLAAEAVARCARAGLWRGETPNPDDCRVSHLNPPATAGG